MLLLGAMAIAGTRLAARLSPAYDEPGHLSAGLSSWNHGDFRPSTGNLFFTQRWAAWPLAARGVQPLPDDEQAELGWNPLLTGEVLLYTGGIDPRTLLAPAREMTLLLCLLGGVLAWTWAARCGGPWAGALAALLYATSPVLLANGTLVTADTGAALWYAAALGCYGWMLQRPSACAAALCGFCAGMMALSKFSVVAWVLAALLLLGWRLWRRPHSVRPWALVGLHALALAVAWATLWSFFGWQFRPGGHVYIQKVPATWIGHAVGLLRDFHLLPEPYLREVITLEMVLAPRPGYFLGAFHSGGSWAFFPVAFAVKSTVAMLLAVAACLWARRAKDAPETPAPGLEAVAAGALAYAAVAVAAPLNIGVRHILPLFVLAAIAGGVALARLAAKGGSARGFVAAVAALGLFEGVSGSQRPLAWFNALAGGPLNGYRLLLDSSLEWGGDLPELIGWERALRQADPVTPVYVSLLGPPGQEHFGLAASDLGTAFERGQVRAGYFVFSATRLVGGPVGLYGQWGDSLRDAWDATGATRWRGPLPRKLAWLGVARLAASCRLLEPTERIGPVYFVYHLDDHALAQALRDPSALSPRPAGAPPPVPGPAGP